jgi:hypothetical protein
MSGTLALVLLVMVGCQTYTPQEMKVRFAKFFVFEERHTPKKLKRELMPGMTREQVHTFYKGQPMSLHLRPANGWEVGVAGTNAHTVMVVGTYEWLHERKVQRCDVYVSPAAHSYFQLLADRDYVFFDGADKLIGFHHEMVGD